MHPLGVTLATTAALLAVQVALAAPTAAAPGDAVMRTTMATKLASEVLTVDVLGNDDPPTGTTWDRSSVCLPFQGSCVKTIAIDGFTKIANDDGSITTYNSSRFGGASGVTYVVRDSAGGSHTAALEVTEKLTPAPRPTDPDDAVRARLRVTQVVDPTSFDRGDQVLSWTSVVTNSGNVDLGGLVVTDASSRLSARSCAPVGLEATLPAGASTTCTGTMAARQDDLDERSDRTDAVTASAATTIGGVAYRASASATATSKPLPKPRLRLDGWTTPSTTPNGDRVYSYAINVHNDGNVTLRDVIVRAPLPGLSFLNCAPIAMGQPLPPGSATQCRGDRYVEGLATGNRTEVVKATATTAAGAVNATFALSLDVPTSSPVDQGPDAGPPIASSDVVFPSVGHPATAAVLLNDEPADQLVGTSVRLRLEPGLPKGSVLYSDAKTLVVPQTQPDPTKPFRGGAVFLVSGRGEITVVPIGYEPAGTLKVGYQVTDTRGRTTRSTLTATISR